MKNATFLSLSPKPWFLSFGIHAVFFLSILFLGQNRTLDLTAIDLDFSDPRSLSVVSQQMDPDAEWQKPVVARKEIPLPVKPLPAPEAPVSLSGAGEGKGSGEIRSVAQVSRRPSLKTKVEPIYPAAAQRANIEGVVILQVDIDATGAVKKVELVQGLGYGCDESAVTAVQLSTFTPAYAGDEAVPVRVRLPYRFELKR